MATHHSLLPEIGPDGLAREAPVIALTEKIIEEEQLQLKRYIEENYSKIRDVERELATLSMEMKLTAGPKKAALELLRKKIEGATERIRVAKLKEDEARKSDGILGEDCASCQQLLDETKENLMDKLCIQVLEDASKVVQEEEANKQKLCDDLNCLVQESTTSQYTRLEELKRRLEALNPSRVSTLSVPVGESGKSMQQGEGSTTAPSPPSLPHPVESAGRVPDNAQNAGNNGNASVANGNNQSQAIESEGRGKRRSNPGRGKGNMILPKGRGSQGSGWTGAGFDVDGRS